jgi:uncharacterized protein (TIGR01244 family)
MKKIILAVLYISLAHASSSLAAQDNDDKLKDIRAYLRISEGLATSGQIRYEQVKDVQKAGFDVVINLAPANKERNAMEGFLVTDAGMTYVHIPVSWKEPSLRDLELFFDVMDANKDRKVYAHCFANMRVSAFVYLYRTLRLGVVEKKAWEDLATIWDPATQDQWVKFMEEARKQLKGE